MSDEDINWDALAAEAREPERRTFEARYYGRCYDSCGEPIEPGDPVCYNTNDELVHEECYQ